MVPKIMLNAKIIKIKACMLANVLFHDMSFGMMFMWNDVTNRRRLVTYKILDCLF